MRGVRVSSTCKPESLSDKTRFQKLHLMLGLLMKVCRYPDGKGFLSSGSSSALKKIIGVARARREQMSQDKLTWEIKYKGQALTR